MLQKCPTDPSLPTVVQSVSQSLHASKPGMIGPEEKSLGVAVPCRLRITVVPNSNSAAEPVILLIMTRARDRLGEWGLITTGPGGSIRIRVPAICMLRLPVPCPYSYVQDCRHPRRADDREMWFGIRIAYEQGSCVSLTGVISRM